MTDLKRAMSLKTAAGSIAGWIRVHPGAALFALLVLLYLPWASLTLFNTKGEPREAIVAVSMLSGGDWILPVSLGGDIPYKPPFLAWCIALVSLIGGHVTEFTSRLPSVIAAVALCMVVYSAIRRQTGSVRTAVVAALVLATSVEVWRAATACRVDMLLTLFIVAATFRLYVYVSGGLRGIPIGAVVLMTLGVLTKGPVAMLLPCLVAGIYGLLRGYPFVRLAVRLGLAGLLSLIVPAIWYVAAYFRGGDEFMRLAMEENFGRMTGTMSYNSHEKPLWYNFVTILTGMLPYTLFVVLVAAGIRRLPAVGFGRIRERLQSMDPWKLYMIVMWVAVFVFYCIPKSKRSVYLLPVYPAMAYGVTLLLLEVRRLRTVRVYAAVLSVIAIVVPLLLWGLTAMWDTAVALTIPPSMTAIGRSITAVTLTASGIASLLLALGTGIAAGLLLRFRPRRSAVTAALLPVVGIYIMLSWSILPAVLNDKSDKQFAAYVEEIAPDGPVYQYVSDRLMRYYTVNFYIGDRVRRFESEMPDRGWLMVDESAVDEWRNTYGKDYIYNTVRVSDRPSCDMRRRVLLLRFSRR